MEPEDYPKGRTRQGMGANPTQHTHVHTTDNLETSVSLQHTSFDWEESTEEENSKFMHTQGIGGTQTPPEMWGKHTNHAPTPATKEKK